MDNTYRPSPRYVSGDPYHALAALAIATITERGDRRPARRRRTKRDPLAGRDRVRRRPRGVELSSGRRSPRAVRTRLRTRRSVEPPVRPATGLPRLHARSGSTPRRVPHHRPLASKEAFETFIAHHRNEYDALDVELHTVTTSETLVGRVIAPRLEPVTGTNQPARRRSTHSTTHQTN